MFKLILAALVKYFDFCITRLYDTAKSYFKKRFFFQLISTRVPLPLWQVGVPQGKLASGLAL